MENCGDTFMQDEATQHRDYVNALFVKNSPQIRGFIISLVPKAELADDVLQETFLTVSAKADDFTAGSNFIAWALRIAKYKVLEEYRRSGRGGKILSPEVIEAICPAITEENEWIQERLVEALKQCLGRLSPHVQKAIELRYKNDYKTKEIATILGWSSNSVSVVLSRGRRSLRKCVSSKMEA